MVDRARESERGLDFEQSQAQVTGRPLRRTPHGPRTFVEALHAAAGQCGPSDENIIHVQQDGTDVRQSYAGLMEEAQRVLGGLRRADVQPGARAILLLESSQDILAAFWGCVLGRVIPVIPGLPPTYDEPNRAFDQLRQVARKLGTPVVVTSRGMRAVDRIAQTLDVRPSDVLMVEQLRGHEPVCGDDGCVETDTLFFSLTSGSTSQPKCIPLTHGNLLSRAAGANQLCGHCREEVALSWLPFDHIGTISDWHLRCVLLGCRAIYAPKETVIGRPLRWIDLIDRYRVTHTWAPNFAYALINDALARGTDIRWDLSCVEAFLTAGEPVSAKVVEHLLSQLAAFGLKPTVIRPAFGMAEMGSGVTYRCATEESPLKVRRVSARRWQV